MRDVLMVVAILGLAAFVGIFAFAATKYSESIQREIKGSEARKAKRERKGERERSG